MLVDGVNNAQVQASVTVYQLELMKHAIGFDRGKVKRGKYKAWRNYYCSYEECDNWNRLMLLELAVKAKRGKAIYYFLTDKGLSFVGSTLGLKVVEDKD